MGLVGPQAVYRNSHNKRIMACDRRWRANTTQTVYVGYTNDLVVVYLHSNRNHY